METTETTTQTLTPEELKTVQEIRVKYAEIAAKLGQLKIEEIILDNQYKRLNEIESKLTQEYLDNQTKESSLSEELSKKYGSGNIDLETGVFTPVPATV